MGCSAIAAFMNRRSRMAAVMAAVPTAAQAARRRKSRRVMTEIFFSCINYFWIVKSGDVMSRCATARMRSRICDCVGGELNGKFVVFVT